MVHLAEQIAKYNDRLPLGESQLDQQTLAGAVGTSPAQVSRHINGATLMTFETALRYAAFFGVRVCEIDDRFSEAVDLATLATDSESAA
jgi:plasmid maintenance system antidote protein VapI